jgi:CheY-like chemotaxis protein
MNFGYGPSDYGRVEPVPGMVVVLLVEDNTPDVLLLREALVQHGLKAQLFVAKDGEEAILLMDEIDDTLIPCPELIVLDLNLPRKTGFEVLERIRLSPKCGRKPVVILSSADSAREREAAARLGVTFYLKKPDDLQEYMKIGEQIKRVLLKKEFE